MTKIYISGYYIEYLNILETLISHDIPYISVQDIGNIEDRGDHRFTVIGYNIMFRTQEDAVMFRMAYD